MKIGTIVEGSTDRLLLKAIIDHIYPGQHTYHDLQPADRGETFGERGSGWKGVRRFCFDVHQQLNNTLSNFIVDYAFDLLVIHVDADIANESDLQDGIDEPIIDVSQSCPPVYPTVIKSRQVIMKWLQVEEDQLPPQVIFAIPAQDSEHWVFATLFPDDEMCKESKYECVHEHHQRPAYKLSLQKYGSIVRRKKGKLKKSILRYRLILPDVVAGWRDACKICTQAQLFTDELLGHHGNSRRLVQEK